MRLVRIPDKLAVNRTDTDNSMHCSCLLHTACVHNKNCISNCRWDRSNSATLLDDYVKHRITFVEVEDNDVIDKKRFWPVAVSKVIVSRLKQFLNFIIRKDQKSGGDNFPLKICREFPSLH